MGKSLKPIGLILIIGLVVAGICLFSVFGGLRNLLGGARDQAGSPVLGGSEQEGELGRMYTALEVDPQGCPAEPASEFYRDETIFVGLEESSIPRGTDLFVRLYHEGQPVEDTPPIQAASDQLSCVWFEFQPQSAEGLEPGEYEAELHVNGNPVETIRFQVANEYAGGGQALPGTGGGPSAELGPAFTATSVDANGCPVDQVYEFFPDETIYTGFDQSYIPAGTEMFARLVHEGQVIEDTQPIYADREMETCVWFEFQAGQFSELPQGDYEVELYANGDLAEVIQFSVRE
jgi:hypothetical protein